MSLFTVEQLELIRRLRGTGITADQILEAFKQLDNIDEDLEVAESVVEGVHDEAKEENISEKMFPENSFFEKMSAEKTFHEQTFPAKTDSVMVDAAVPSEHPVLERPTPLGRLESHVMQPECNSPILLQALRSQAPVAVTISAAASPIAKPMSPERISFQTVPAASSAHETEIASSSNATILPHVPVGMNLPKYELNAGGRPIRSLRTPMNDIIVLDDPTELDEFMTQGEEGCIMDMKQFINQYSLRQTTVAMMTGVSQPYISKLLNGNHRELSLRCRKNIYCWYLNCRRHPEKLAAFLADPSTRLETNGEGELVPQRRERYVFRPILIRILENFFAQTPFPDLNRRIEIATACNHVLQMDKKGVGLMPKEVVSPQVVANWFANKRKEIRRRSQEANNNAMAQNGSVIKNEDTTSPHTIDSTPSPHEDEDHREEEMPMLPAQPSDIFSIVQRLGINLANFQQNMKDENPMFTPIPMVSLASQLLMNHVSQSLQPPQTSESEQMVDNFGSVDQALETKPLLSHLLSSFVQPELRPELQPELQPELRPELRPEQLFQHNPLVHVTASLGFPIQDQGTPVSYNGLLGTERPPPMDFSESIKQEQ